MPANMAEAGFHGFAAMFRLSADNLNFCLEHDGSRSNRRDAQLTSPRRGEVDAHRQMRGG
jgi:hypothetical protein